MRNAWMLIKKPRECRGSDWLRRMPSNLPTLKSFEFCWESCREQCFHRLCLAKVIGLPPCLESSNHRGALLASV